MRASAVRVALLADVHANLHALEAVLAAARAERCERVWVAGDWLGYGAFPMETLGALEAVGAIGVHGDMDVEVLSAAAGTLPADASEAKRRALAWTAAQLSRPALETLRGLGAQRRLRAGPLAALLVHGSPAAIGEHVWPDTPHARLRSLAELAEVPLVVCGHTHQAMDRRAGSTRFLNPGSVGRPGDGDPRACWGLLEVEPDGAGFRALRVSYAHHAAGEAVRAAGLPGEVARMFEEGRSLADVLGNASPG
jgi:putative phosphoesterase